MEQFPQFNNEFLEQVGATLRELRRSHGYSIEDLIVILKKKFGLKMSANLMSKIENGNSKIQIEQYLALAYLYRMENSEIFSYSQFDNSLEKDISTLSKRNPDIKFILDSILDHSENFQYINHIKSVAKSAIHLFQSRKELNSQTVLKAAHPKKKN